MYQCHSDRHDVIDYSHTFPFIFIHVLLCDFSIQSYQQQSVVKRHSSIASAASNTIF
jgi:hypothetical protein